ncbi:hypothetical protein COO60DRAFT_132374 [Scenedesmus sp. NREL 46B-D3]|nr:hypothetical protein COO60DRAFT_132374 [Scenedesmus sp. NREL 46B-D3]
MGRWACAQLLLLSSCLVANLLQASAADATSLAQPDYSIYLKKNDLLKKVERLVAANPDIMKLEIRHAQDEGYKADLQVVTVELGGLTPSHTTKARALIDFGEHGREFISSEVGLRLLQVLADPQLLQNYTGPGKRLQRLNAILQQTVLKILPMENTNGRDLVESGQLCERKNGRGVDPNRNWGIDWGKKEKDYNPAEEYPGKAPHSEPEVQILLALAKELRPHAWLNVHSGMYALFTPYDHKAVVPNTSDARAALRILQRIKELSCSQCVVGSGGHSVGYLAHGTGTDYMYEVLGIPMSFTWEIYGDENATFEDCFRMFNPLGKQQFDEVVDMWVKALLHLFELLPSHPATGPVFRNVLLAKEDADAAAAAAADEDEGDAALPVAAKAAPPAAAAATQQQPQGSEQKEEGPEEDVQEQEEQQQRQQQQQQAKDVASPAPASASVVQTAEVVGASPAASTLEPVAEVEQDDEYTARQGEEQEVKQQPQQQADKSEEIRIQRIYRGEEEGEDGSGSATWVLLHSNRLAPLLLGLSGMGVLLYLVTRPSGTPYTKVISRRTL